MVLWRGAKSAQIADVGLYRQPTIFPFIETKMVMEPENKSEENLENENPTVNTVDEQDVVSVEPGLNLVEEDEEENSPDSPSIDIVLEDPELVELRKENQELTSRLRAVSAAYKNQQDDIAATRKRLERQAVLKEEIRRGEVVSSLFEPLENLRRSKDSMEKS